MAWRAVEGGALDQARDHAHHALQLVAAAGYTHLPRDAEWQGSNAGFASGRLVGRELADGVRVSLDLASLNLEVSGGEPAVRAVGRFDPSAHAAWLRARLRERGLADRELVFPSWDLPEAPAGLPDPAALAQLADWYANAHELLSVLAEHPAAGEVRCWPHHFDLAVLLTLRPGPLGTVGIGMTPGDGGVPEPYLYATPWPYPDPEVLPELARGGWNTEGWVGAVLAASELAAVGPAEAQALAAHDFARAATTVLIDVVRGGA